jgi:hypothetical protein
MAPQRRRRSGAQRIAAILDTPQTDLNRAMATTGKGFFASETNPDAQPSRATYRGIRVVRAEYQSMSRRIANIETARKEAKADVLDALKRFDSSLAAFAKALPSDHTEAGAAALDRAAREAKSATADLKTARGKLS